MLLNGTMEDINKLLESRGRSQYEVGKKLFGGTGSIWMLGTHHNISTGFERMIELLGYDIEFAYEERLPEGKNYLNDLKKDVEMLCWWKGTNLYALARETGKHASNYYQAMDKEIVKKRYYLICKELGYGIRLKYIPREEK